jgi:hypothetical protein
LMSPSKRYPTSQSSPPTTPLRPISPLHSKFSSSPRQLARSILFKSYTSIRFMILILGVLVLPQANNQEVANASRALKIVHNLATPKSK